MEEILIPTKRKRVVLTLEQKLEVIKLKDEGKFSKIMLFFIN